MEIKTNNIYSIFDGSKLIGVTVTAMSIRKVEDGLQAMVELRRTDEGKLLTISAKELIKKVEFAQSFRPIHEILTRDNEPGDPKLYELLGEVGIEGASITIEIITKDSGCKNCKCRMVKLSKGRKKWNAHCCGCDFSYLME